MVVCVLCIAAWLPLMAPSLASCSATFSACKILLITLCYGFSGKVDSESCHRGGECKSTCKYWQMKMPLLCITMCRISKQALVIGTTRVGMRNSL